MEKKTLKELLFLLFIIFTNFELMISMPKDLKPGEVIQEEIYTEPVVSEEEQEIAALRVSRINPREEKCTVCMEFLESEGAGDWIILPCGHAFHKACINPWLRESGTCPNCQAIIDRDAYNAKQEKEERRPQIEIIVNNVISSLWEMPVARWQLEERIEFLTVEEFISILTRLGIYDVLQLREPIAKEEFFQMVRERIINRDYSIPEN